MRSALSKAIKLYLPGVLLLTTGMVCHRYPLNKSKQGITGYILEVRGNQMPALGKPTSKGRGVSRDICFYAPATAADVDGAAPLYTKIKTRLVATTRSDSTGMYQAGLPPGKYSVFIKDGGKFFASESDGAGVLCPVEVQPNTLTHKDVTLNYRAVY